MRYNSTMKVLVTGGAGFIGSHLVDRLIKEKNRVVVIDNLSTGKREHINPRATFYKADIADFGSVSRIFRKERPEVVFHLAAIPRVPISVQDPIATTRVNVLGTLHVFKAATEVKVNELSSRLLLLYMEIKRRFRFMSLNYQRLYGKM